MRLPRMGIMEFKHVDDFQLFLPECALFVRLLSNAGIIRVCMLFPFELLSGNGVGCALEAVIKRLPLWCRSLD